MPKMEHEILRTEFSEDFVTGMKNRMIMSYYKYGAIADAFPKKVDAITSLTDRLKEYTLTGNTEFLIDAANFAMIEFMYPKHPKAFFEATDHDKSPGRRNKRGIVDHRNNDDVGKR